MVGHGKRGAGGDSKKIPTPLADDSFIVFSNGKDDRKENKEDSNASSKRSGSRPSQPAGEDAAKKADTRTRIGGSSWTGKLPVNLLSEHCQKQKWGKPEYTMTKTPDGFSSMVILKAVSPKTKESLTLPPLKLPPTHKHLALQPTAIEARHFAATYALFRVCSMRNIHMMLPPSHRDFWKEFEEFKKDDLKCGKGWMYEGDPFAAKREREEAQILMAKKREEREKERAREEASPFALELRGVDGGRHEVLRGWNKATKIEMGRHTRSQVEDMVRKHAVWNPHATVLSENQKDDIVNELTGLGFRKGHVEEAATECKDREEVLEWLLIHVPEDDLPRWSLPEGYIAGISMASGNIKREATIKRLADTGYAVEICETLLDKHEGDEARTAEALQNLLFQSAGDDNGGESTIEDLTIDAGNEGEIIWNEELNTLKSIYGNRFHKVSSSLCQVEVELSHARDSIILGFRKSHGYPSSVPIVTIVSKGLPAYIRLSIYRQIIEYTKASLLHQPMIFNIIDWLQSELPRLIEHPGRLQDVFAIASPARRHSSAADQMSRKRAQKRPPPIQWKPGNAESRDIHQRWQRRQETSEQRTMLVGRQSLPAWMLRDAIVETVNCKQVTIISGETGSGKSTQAVQFILDDMIQRQLGSAANIICTQPRRISALGLADRVAEERCSAVGDEVGYAIRGESKQKVGGTKITFVTTGVLLRRLTSAGSDEDSASGFAGISHVFVDEVHERSIDTDFLLILLRNVLAKRRDLKVVLMSATLDALMFERYFQSQGSVGMLEIQGRTFPVEEYYLDDLIHMTDFTPSSTCGTNDEEAPCTGKSMAGMIQAMGMRTNYRLIAATIDAIDSQLGNTGGGILIFVPGVTDIHRTLDATRSSGNPNIYALPLHSGLTSGEQKRVFLPVPRGKRKVVISTNIAETSITIEDIVAVIDSGKVKETSFDPQNSMVRLDEVWASRAACKQRKGRAGRVRAGKCYKLYTRDAEAKMAERPEPEIRRVPLEQLCLSIRAMGIKDLQGFLASVITPPQSMVVEGAIGLLSKMGALDGDELTALGMHLARIPADLRCSKLMVYGNIFGCLEATVTIASILTLRTPFVSPQNAREEVKAARSKFAPSQGDLLTDLAAYDAWEVQRQSSNYRAVRIWCESHFLSSHTLSDISSTRSQYIASLTEAGFLPQSYRASSSAAAHFNAHNGSLPLLRALIAAAFDPQLARIEMPATKYAASSSGSVPLDPEARTIKYFTPDTGRAFLHPSSTLFDTQVFPGGVPPVCLAYFTKMATSKVFLRDVAPVGAYAALMFCGSLEVDTLGRGVVVGGWLRMRGWARIGVLVGRLRGMVEEVLRRRIDGGPWGEADEEIVGVVRRLVELDGIDR